MKKALLIGFIVFGFVIGMRAQTFHNYYNAQVNLYVQVGFGGQVIQYRCPVGQTTPFVTLNFIGNQNGLAYYGNNNNFQVAINSNSTQVCVINNQGATWFNYVGPVAIPNPYVGVGTTPTYNNGTQTKSRCSWCNGTGRITKNDHVTQYGSNDYTVTERCRECGYEYISTYTHHYHLDCGHCGGTGYFR